MEILEGRVRYTYIKKESYPAARHNTDTNCFVGEGVMQNAKK